MNLNEDGQPVTHPAVREAYEKGEYTDQDGTTYRRGMDGWFSNDGTVINADGTTHHMTMLTYHHDMVNHIIEDADPTETNWGDQAGVVL